MKRFLPLFAAALLLSAALCATASASVYDSAAQELAAIGIFRGSASGFELDRAPTRSEAAIILTRLYGAEESARTAYEAGEIRHPFTDVSAAASPYIAWLYTNGIANGVSATTFGSARTCTARNYLVFLLRVLGYQDGVDFQYADAPAFAASKGLLSLSVLSGTFLRDDLVALTCQALACDLKDGSDYLLDSLVKSGAVDRAAATPIMEKIEAYRALAAASTGSGLDTGIALRVDLQAGLSGPVIGPDGPAGSEIERASFSGFGNVQILLDGENPQMGMQLRLQVMDEATDMGMWLRDGWMYLQQDGASYKVNPGSRFDAIWDQCQTLLNQTAPQSGACIMPYIESITAAKSGGDTVYTLTLNSAMSGVIGKLLDLVMVRLGEDAPDFIMDMDLSRCAYTYIVGSDNQLKQAAVQARMRLDMSEEQSAFALTVTVNLDMTMEVNATGGSVRVSYPANLDQFPELIGGADAPIAA